MELERYLAERRLLIERRLAEALPPQDAHPPAIHQAIRYAVLGGGKRLRPIVTLATAELVGGKPAQVLDAAVALELIHAATLVLDDLPSMDDAHLRRGRPATHLAHGESTAILAAVALLVHAFDLIATNAADRRLGRERFVRVIHETARSTGSVGLIAGQVEDLAAAREHGAPLDLGRLEYIHRHKTGQLFVLAATLGPLLVGARDDDVDSIASYARNLGLAYQIRDDLLDRVGLVEETGKDAGQDRDRTTFASLLSSAEAERLVADLTETACGWIRAFGARARVLEDLARAMVRRRA